MAVHIPHSKGQFWRGNVICTANGWLKEQKQFFYNGIRALDKRRCIALAWNYIEKETKCDVDILCLTVSIYKLFEKMPLKQRYWSSLYLCKHHQPLWQPNFCQRWPYALRYDTSMFTQLFINTNMCKIQPLSELQLLVHLHIWLFHPFSARISAEKIMWGNLINLSVNSYRHKDYYR